VDPARLDQPRPRLDGGYGAPEPFLVWQPRPKYQDRVWLHVLLLLLTLGSTTVAGVIHYVAFESDLLPSTLAFSPGLLAQGLWYSLTILAILGCHELGHYFACRYYDVDASLPFFLPFPLPLTGTLGAVIRIREPIPSKRMLFDIGIAGPIAGVVVVVPALFLGLSWSRIVPLPADFSGYELGEPLLLRLIAWLLWGPVPDGYSLNLHPIAFAAWFGLLATALNLFPFGQFDGGHISYAVFGPRSTYVSLATAGGALFLSYFSTSWIVWTMVMVGMLFAFGPRHPRTIDEHLPLDGGRIALAVLALVMFVLCFTPAPIEPLDLIGR
jgi:membrane-associated protease RseP (regulator of RpoE activity)